MESKENKEYCRGWLHEEIEQYVKGATEAGLENILDIVIPRYKYESTVSWSHFKREPKYLIYCIERFESNDKS